MTTTPQAQVSEDEIISALYRRFKEWSKRGFGPEDVTWCEVKADILKLIEIHSTPPALDDVAALVEGDGWIVGNGARETSWRSWNEMGPSWVNDPNDALRFARREDAERFCADDEDAWTIRRYSEIAAQSLARVRKDATDG